MWFDRSKKQEAEVIELLALGLKSNDIAQMYSERQKTNRLRLWRPIVVYTATLTALTSLVGYWLS